MVKKEDNESTYEHVMDRGNAKEEKSKIAKFLAKRNVWQLAIIGALGLFFTIYSIYWIASLITFSNAFWLFVILFIVNLVCSMWLLNKIGLAVCIMILLGLLVKYGALTTIAMIWITCLVWMYFSTRPTPVDFAITKGVQGAFAMMIYQTIWVIVMAPIVWYLGTAYILSNLVLVYMLSTAFYVLLMVIFLPIFAHEPIPTAFMNGMVMLGLEYAQVKLYGTWFFAYIMSL